MSDALERNSTSPGPPTPPRRGRHPVSFGIWTALLLLVGLVLYDFRDMLLAGARKRQALALIQPGERLTQAERTLNAAGYHTSYFDGPPAMVEVSLLKNSPLTTFLIAKIAGKSPLDIWLYKSLVDATHFMILADDTGAVKFNDRGRPETRHPEIGNHPPAKSSF